MGRKRGKALVTGASSGIGRETAIKLANEGFQVIASGRRSERLTELAKQNSQIIPRPVDLADPYKNPGGRRSKLSKFPLRKSTMPIRKWGRGR